VVSFQRVKLHFTLSRFLLYPKERETIKPSSSQVFLQVFPSSIFFRLFPSQPQMSTSQGFSLCKACKESISLPTVVSQRRPRAFPLQNLSLTGLSRLPHPSSFSGREPGCLWRCCCRKTTFATWREMRLQNSKILWREREIILSEHPHLLCRG
jgi:hypothetical protein